MGGPWSRGKLLHQEFSGLFLVSWACQAEKVLGSQDLGSARGLVCPAYPLLGRRTQVCWFFSAGAAATRAPQASGTWPLHSPQRRRHTLYQGVSPHGGSQLPRRRGQRFQAEKSPKSHLFVKSPLRALQLNEENAALLWTVTDNTPPSADPIGGPKGRNPVRTGSHESRYMCDSTRS